jgi:ABC-type branched-subunit amino acid transport system ATPase component
MDGDTSTIPLTWIRAVFDQVKFIIGNKRVCVVSVIGVQSSGKSTMLNTMFGLDFAVSAGRCTRGIYAQLVKTDNENLP